MRFVAAIVLSWWCLSIPLFGEYALRLEGPFTDEAACTAWQLAHPERISTKECWEWPEEGLT